VNSARHRPFGGLRPKGRLGHDGVERCHGFQLDPAPPAGSAAGLAFFGMAIGTIGAIAAQQQRYDYSNSYGYGPGYYGDGPYYCGGGPYYGGPYYYGRRYYRPY